VSGTSIGTVMDALVAALSQRPNLSEVKVSSGPLSPEDAGLESIELGEARLVQSPAAMGGNVEENWNIDGDIYCSGKPYQGSDEETIKAARDRALVLLAELETHVNDTYAGSLPDMILTGATLTPLAFDEGRRYHLQFTLTMGNLKNP